VRESSRSGRGARVGASAASFVAWSESNRTFDALAAYRPWGFDLGGAAGAEHVRGARVSANLFAMLGVSALRGRTFRPGDAAPGRPRVVLLSEGVWRRRFGAAPGVIGRPLDLSGEPHLVVGVVRRGFALPEAELWVPLTFASYELSQFGDRSLSVI